MQATALTPYAHAFNSYNGDELEKLLALTPLNLRYAHGSIMQGSYAQCEIASTVTNGAYDHRLFAKELGVDLGIPYIGEGIFESLPAQLAPAFAVDVAETLEPGRNTAFVPLEMMVTLLNNVSTGLINHTLPFPQQYAAVANVVELLEQTLSGNIPAVSQWKRTAIAARLAGQDSMYVADKAIHAAFTAYWIANLPLHREFVFRGAVMYAVQNQLVSALTLRDDFLHHLKAAPRYQSQGSSQPASRLKAPRRELLPA